MESESSNGGSAGNTPRRRQGETVSRGGGALALDFDGTLTMGEQPLKEGLLRALADLRARGTKVILATGRCIGDIGRLTGTDLFDGVIAENGALLVVAGMKKTMAPEGWADVRAGLLSHFDPGCEEVIISASIDTLEAAKRVVPADKAQIVLNKDRLMILPHGVNKGTGLSEVLSSLHVPGNEVTCVGDGENDLSMFDVVGVRVALANSVDALKRRADYVAKSGDGEGTLEALEALFPRPRPRQGRGVP